MSTIITDAMKDLECVFQTKSPNDTQVWQGTIAGPTVSYAVAKIFRNIVPVNNAVRSVDQTVNADPTQLSYFLLSVPNADPTLAPSITAFAQEWLADGTFELITTNVPVQLTVYKSPTGATQDIIDLLAQGGYVAYETPSN